VVVLTPLTYIHVGKDAENGLSDRFRRLLHGLWGDLKRLDQRVAEMDKEIALIAEHDPVAKRLQQLRGVGPMVATALIASVGDGKQFRNGRQMAASLGLTPRQHSSGGKDRLLGISKRGDAYLRSLLIHGARSAIYAARGKEDRLSQWVINIASRRHPNVAAAALANKTGHIAWAKLPRPRLCLLIRSTSHIHVVVLTPLTYNPCRQCYVMTQTIIRNWQ